MPIKPAPCPARTHGRVLIAAILLAAAHLASAQVHEVTRGDLTLRSSTVSSERIDPATAARHGIAPSPSTAVLNVVVLRGNGARTVPATVTATARNLVGIRQELDMQEVRENGRVSYLGAYDVAPREVIDIEVRASVPAAPRELLLRYRERAWGVEADNASK